MARRARLAILLVPIVAAAASAWGLEAPRTRLLLNNDGTNLLWRDDLSLELVSRHAAECPAAVTTYLLCPNGIQKMLYPSDLEEVATRGALSRLIEAGQDPFGEMLAALKRRGMETFITFRMNEVHNVDRADEPDLSRFWREHPEYRVARGEYPGDWMSQCLDYSIEAVRQHSLGLIFELMSKYRPDGIELDWMRFPHHLSGDAWEGRAHLTETVARVRARADELSRAMGRPFLVAVRVPPSVAGWNALGADVPEWNRRALVDFVTVSPFLASDFRMPIGEMRKALGDRPASSGPLPIYAGIEHGYSGRPHREATLHAAALGLLEDGADGIYLFNFPCWRETQPHPPWSWVPPLADWRRLARGDLDVALIDGTHRVPGIDLPPDLPITVAAGATRETSLRIPRWAFAGGTRFRSARVEVEPAGLEVTVNGTPADGGGTLLTSALFAGGNRIALRNPGAEAVAVTRLELSLGAAPLPPDPRLSPEGTVRFHVSPSGDDGGGRSNAAPDSGNPGSAEAPFRTIARAIRAARGRGRWGAPPCEIVLHAGVHELRETLVLQPGDSHLRFVAEPGESPVLSGGRRIAGWEPGEGGRWRARVEGLEFRQLWVDGVRARRARGPCPEGVEPWGSLDWIDAEAGHLFPDGALAGWRHPEDLELGYFNSWSHMICRVAGVRREPSGRAAVRMLQPWFFLASKKEGVQARSPAYIENAMELLDEPGEWYHDRRAGTLHYLPRPGEDMRKASVVAPVLETLVLVDGTPDAPVLQVDFEGITFAEATWLGPSRIGHADVQANFTTEPDRLFARDGWVVAVHNEYRKSPANVVLRGAVGCRFERCTFTRLGGAALDVERGSREVSVVRCAFHDISGSAVQIGDVRADDHHPSDPRLVVRDNSVLGCEVRDCGVEYEDSVGVFVGYAAETTIAHNDISSLPYSGVSVGWGWGEEDAGGGAYETIPYRYETPTPAGANRIERNHIHHVMLRRDDGGGVYMLGNQPGTAIRWNHIHDAGPGGPGGIYLDEGSGFIEISGNAVYRVPRAMNYNNRAQDRISTCFEHSNAFDVEPGAPGFPEDVASRAGRPKAAP